MTEHKIQIEPHRIDIFFSWTDELGRGQFLAKIDDESKLRIVHECISRDRVRAHLHALADHIADNCITLRVPHEKRN